MTDLAKTEGRELLEMAAKAAGYEIETSMVGGEEKLYLKGDLLQWAPLTDDGDALRLAVKLRLDIELSIGEDIMAVDHWDAVNERYVTDMEATGEDPYAATRRAIVCAAAAIGKAMP
jgi:hypothetical protein